MRPYPVEPSGKSHLFVGSGRATPRSRTENMIRLTDGVRVNLDVLKGYCVREMSDAVYDFLVVAASVSQIDRWCHRNRRSAAWVRELSLTIEVHDPDRWNDVAISSALSECLHYLTGDCWGFEFLPRDQPRVDLGNGYLEYSTPPANDRVAIPYSGGLDSYAQVQLFSAEESVNPLLVTTWVPAQSGILPAGMGSVSGKDLVSVNVQRSDRNHAEPSYRSRTFLFNTVAAVAAHLADIQTVVIPENGQGCLGAALVPVGDEWPARGTSPGFTSRLASLLQAASDVKVTFDHPRVWDTKGEVLLKLRELAALDRWEATTSCPRNIRRSKPGTNSRHCGVCGGCLHRRLAVHRCGISSNDGDYFWRDLGAKSLFESAPELTKAPKSNNDWDIALHNVRFMQELSLLADRIPNAPAFSQSAFEVAQELGIGREDASKRLQRLIEAHSCEWKRFLGSLDPSSWVRAICGE